MLIEPPAKFRKRYGRVKPTGGAPGPVAPVLVAATFDTSDGAVLTLTFDRAVQVVGFAPSAVLVVNEPGESRYDGGAGAFLLSPTSVKVEMTQIEVIPIGADVLLSASGATGIVAAEGGAEWAGVDALGLPFP